MEIHWNLVQTLLYVIQALPVLGCVQEFYTKNARHFCLALTMKECEFNFRNPSKDLFVQKIQRL